VISEIRTASTRAAASDVYAILDEHEIPYSVVAGNHDVAGSSTYDDERGHEVYLDYFSPARFAGKPSFGGASESGYNTFHLFEG